MGLLGREKEEDIGFVGRDVPMNVGEMEVQLSHFSPFLSEILCK